jgi:hypothetical protein
VPAIDFPNSPSLGQVFTAANKSWTWDGSKWIVTQYNNAIDNDVTDYIDQKFEEAVAFAIFFS